MDKALRLAFLDALATHIGRVERRTAREHTAHRWGYGPVLVWSASSGFGTLLVSPYSSGSGVVRVHVNRYAEESRLLGWTAEITVVPVELVELVPWFAEFIRERSMGRMPPVQEFFSEGFFHDGVPKYIGIWTKRASETEREHMNARGLSPVKETR